MGFTVLSGDRPAGRQVRPSQAGRLRPLPEYDADPVERAREWERQGAPEIHVVDLDGAKGGHPAQLDLIREITGAVGVPVQVGGGVRTLEDLRAVREAGAGRIVMGTAAVGDRGLRLRAIDEFGGMLVVAVDARDGVVSTHGWQRSSGVGVLELAEELAAGRRRRGPLYGRGSGRHGHRGGARRNRRGRPPGAGHRQRRGPRHRRHHGALEDKRCDRRHSRYPRSTSVR